MGREDIGIKRKNSINNKINKNSATERKTASVMIKMTDHHLFFLKLIFVLNKTTELSPSLHYLHKQTGFDRLNERDLNGFDASIGYTALKTTHEKRIQEIIMHRNKRGVLL